MDQLDLLAVQGILNSLLQRHSLKAPILLCSAFFIVQLSHPYMTTVKTIALTRQTFVDKVLSLLFNMLSSLEGRKCNKIKSRIWRPTNWRTVIPKKFSHSCEDSELCVRLPSLRILQRHWDPQGIWLWTPVGFDYKNSIGLKETETLGERKQCKLYDWFCIS